MTTKVIRTACPKDCRDTCSLLVTVKDGRVIKVTGDPENELTQGFDCSKARDELKRLYSPERLIYPRIKDKGSWKRVNWEEALDLIANKIKHYCKNFGSLSIMHYSDAGSMGWLHDLSKRFFNLLGGVTTVKGSLCSAAGKTAQKLDFGDVIAHDPVDILNAKNIIIWGRNPAHTNIHLLPLLKETRGKGAYVTLVDPVPTRSVNYCDRHIAPVPGTDGLLALGMAKIIINKNLHDSTYLKNNVIGFEKFRKSLEDISLGYVEKNTGIDKETIEIIAERYATEKPGAILLGFGLQRYHNSGTTIRAIDALGAITGNIGVQGGGVNYSCGYHRLIKPDITAKKEVKYKREFPKPAAARHILQAANPPVKNLFITTANPAAQLPNSSLVKEAINSVDFTVVLDLEMTETAEMADVVLPVTTFYEQKNIYGAWGHNYITYGERAINPRGEAKNDWEIFAKLAERLGFGKEFGDSDRWLEKLLQPYLDEGTDYQDVIGKTFRCKGAPYVPWRDGNFNTSSGKFELYSEQAKELNIPPLPAYQKLAENITDEMLSGKYSFHLLSPAHVSSIHSQFYENVEPGEYPVVHLGSKVAGKKGIKEGALVNIITERGELTARVKTHSNYRDDVALVYCGGSPRDKKDINRLTSDRITDIGNCGTFYDCLCDIKPLK